MTRLLGSSVARIERKTADPTESASDSGRAGILRAIERYGPFGLDLPEMPEPPPTVIDIPVVTAPPEQARTPELPPPPEPIGGQPTEFPELMRPVTWRLRGPQDWNDDSEDMVGKCRTDYDPLGYLDEEDA